MQRRPFFTSAGTVALSLIAGCISGTNQAGEPTNTSTDHSRFS
jgi:hypothetical protein